MASSGEDNWSCDPQLSSDCLQNNQPKAKMKKEQKRRPKPKDGTLLACGVCGDKALGYNFDAITCESCKAFFRRNALKAKTFPCSFDGNCKLDVHTRKFCSGCRLKKCFDIGMKKEWILSEDQLARRRQRSKDQVSQDTPPAVAAFPCSSTEVTSNYHSDDLPSPSSGCSTQSSEFLAAKDEPGDDSFSNPLPEDIKKGLTEMEALYTSIFDAPYETPQAARLSEPLTSANDIFNLTDMFIRRLIKFSKCIPEFKALSQEDQISLLKGGIMEIFVLRSAMGFDKREQMWKYKTEKMGSNKLDPKVIQSTLGKDMFTQHMRFVKSLHELTGSDRFVMMLLFLIELFADDRPNLIQKDLVSNGQEKYSLWLRKYLESVHSVAEARSLYPKLLMKLLDVRSLGEGSSQLAAQLDVTKLEPLLVEIFNLTP